MAMKVRATIDDLYDVPGRAELVFGEVVLMSPTGDFPAHAAGEIFASLRDYARKSRLGRAFTDNVAFLVNLPNRQSFSPDASFYSGPAAGMKFLPVPPIFAVEVRSDGDYGTKAEREIEQKRRDYFDAGTKAVWDVDLLCPDVVKLYTMELPLNPAIFRRGDNADAGSILPGWSIPVDDLFFE